MRQALAQADIGMLLVPAQISRWNQADIVLMRSDLMDVPTAVELK